MFSIRSSEKKSDSKLLSAFGIYKPSPSSPALEIFIKGFGIVSNGEEDLDISDSKGIGGPVCEPCKECMLGK